MLLLYSCVYWNIYTKANILLLPFKNPGSWRQVCISRNYNHFVCCRVQSFITNLQCSVFYSRLFLIIRCACRQNTIVRTVRTNPLILGVITSPAPSMDSSKWFVTSRRLLFSIPQSSTDFYICCNSSLRTKYKVITCCSFSRRTITQYYFRHQHVHIF